MTTKLRDNFKVDNVNFDLIKLNTQWSTHVTKTRSGFSDSQPDSYSKTLKLLKNVLQVVIKYWHAGYTVLWQTLKEVVELGLRVL
jgi:hypothetical protein